MIIARVLSGIIGYLFGCFLTADLVAKKIAGTNASDIGGSGNPGMANVMARLGFLPGLVTLAGDLLKCILAALVSYALFKSTGHIVVFYAGVGCTIGHIFPFWRRFHGGKGVATTCIAVGLYAFWPGLAANIIGMLVVFATKYLCIGGPAIPLSFTLFMFARGDLEGGILAAVLTLIAFYAHGKDIRGISRGTSKKTDVLGAITRKIKGEK